MSEDPLRRLLTTAQENAWNRSMAKRMLDVYRRYVIQMTMGESSSNVSHLLEIIGDSIEELMVADLTTVYRRMSRYNLVILVSNTERRQEEWFESLDREDQDRLGGLWGR